ncbi:hypothetical protein [Burkholderia sp. Tr-20390]|uniref:hypothetical protein n=1 Tax=Burkholderia sp. Tr-20390 TaxID=2703904 RepID=UPI00197CEA2E|nr:hypothetical protein [Burkholderia sp. Tr-20390]MBN3736448.1 hypothetical protein [Burkholderia sp. Tr-20390]
MTNEKQARCFLRIGQRDAAGVASMDVHDGQRCQQPKRPFRSMRMAGRKRAAAGRAEDLNRTTRRRLEAGAFPANSTKNVDQKAKRFFPLNLIHVYPSRV